MKWSIKFEGSQIAKAIQTRKYIRKHFTGGGGCHGLDQSTTSRRCLFKWRDEDDFGKKIQREIWTAHNQHTCLATIFSSRLRPPNKHSSALSLGSAPDVRPRPEPYLHPPPTSFQQLNPPFSPKISPRTKSGRINFLPNSAAAVTMVAYDVMAAIYGALSCLARYAKGWKSCEGRGREGHGPAEICSVSAPKL